MQATLDDVYEFYITPDEYATAARNGVSAQLLEQRIRKLAWKKERAINTPPHPQKSLKEWSGIAKQNGISYKTLKCRLSRGWDIERAATQPLLDKKARSEWIRERNRKYPPELLETARSNGIPIKTFYRRVKIGWDMHTAATRPLITPSEIGLMTKEKRQPCFFRV